MADRLSGRIISKIIRSYNIVNGNAYQTSNKLDISCMTIIRYLRKEGLKINRRGGRIVPRKEINKINSFYKTFKRNANKTSKEIRCSRSFVVKCWKKHGFDMKKPEKKQEKKERKYHYRGSACALDYFIENIERYAGLKRNEINLFDSGLYRTLYRNSNLDIAMHLSKWCSS